MDGRARIVWKLARDHTWGTPMPADTLVRMAATDEDHDEMRSQLEDALELPFVVRGRDGVYIPNGRDVHVEAAERLRGNT